MSDQLARLRWCIANPGSTAFRVVEEIVNSAILPLRTELENWGVESFYVSKHSGREVWLTIFSRLTVVPDIITRVESQLVRYQWRSEHTSDTAHEQLLQPSCAGFRQCIATMTRVALDLHTPEGLLQHQKALISIGCQNRADRSRLEPHLQQHSVTYTQLPDPGNFWGTFGSNCLTGQRTDCGHWLYNVVLGVDWFQGQREAAVAGQLGIEWP